MRCAEFRVRLDAVLDARRWPQRNPELKVACAELPQVRPVDGRPR